MTRELRLWSVCALTGVIFSVALAALPAFAAKPTPRPAPTCVSGSLGTPTLAFLWSNQVWVGNADGTCALALAPVAQYYPLAFAFDGAKYKVFWMADTRDEVKLISRQRWTIKSVEFTVVSGNISESRPLPVRELWRDDVTTSQSDLWSIGVNTNASRLAFTRTYAGVAELKNLDLSSCKPTCASPTTLLAPISDLFGAQFGRAGDDRLYYWHRAADYSWWQIGFYENAGGPLSGPVVVVDSSHPRYQGTRAGGPRISGVFRGTPSSDDMMAFGWVRVLGTDSMTDVIQVGAGCVPGLPTSCLASGAATIVAQDVPQSPGSSTAEWTPSGFLHRLIQPGDGTYRILTADPLFPSQVLFDHGVGNLPAGLKQ